MQQKVASKVFFDFWFRIHSKCIQIMRQTEEKATRYIFQKNKTCYDAFRRKKKFRMK